jgi:heat shock protein HtpX
MGLSRDYQQQTMDWRQALAQNQRRSFWVMACFIFIYATIGLLMDAYWVSMQAPYAPLSVIFEALLTLRITPYCTIGCLGIAIISLWITFTFHAGIMLLGTRSTEVTARSETPEHQRLFNVVEEMKVAAGLRFMPRVFIIQANYMNAFASGFNEKSAMIAITEGLLKKLDRDELTAVMAHELSHIKHGDIKLTLMASVLSNLILIMIDFLFYGLIVGNDGRARGRGGLLLIIMLLRFTLPIVTLLLLMFLSRSREYMADAGCVELMRDNEPLARALIKIRDDSLKNKEQYAQAYHRTKHENIRREAYIFDPIQANIKPAASPSDWFSTHPGFTKRLAALGFKKKTPNPKH